MKQLKKERIVNAAIGLHSPDMTELEMRDIKKRVFKKHLIGAKGRDVKRGGEMGGMLKGGKLKKGGVGGK
jgi:hypothetical protein